MSLSMTLTGASRATPEGCPPQLHLGPDGPNSLARTVTIDNLPDEALLHIFDFYRQSFWNQRDYEKVWNNKNGWFKLAQVCRNWRFVVLASPSRSRLRLYFTPTSTRAGALEPFSHLPIIVDYSNVAWDADTQKGLISALRYPGRVCRIAIGDGGNRWNSRETSVLIFNALDLPFPELDSLELCGIRWGVIPATSFMTSIRSLRLFWFDSPFLDSLLPLLSVTRSLVDLTLGISSIFFTTDREPFFIHLQRMPHLRTLQVSMHRSTTAVMPPNRTVLLEELTNFRISANCSQVDWFVAGLVAPSLRELEISAIGTSGTLRFRHLSEFIRITGIIFLAARFSMMHHTFVASLFTHPHSIEDPTSKVVTILMADSHLVLGDESSVMVATLEEIFFKYENLMPGDLARLRKFFEEFRNVKVLRIDHGLETAVANMLRQPTIPAQDVVETTPSDTPINSNRRQSTLDIFPSLEEIVVYPMTLDTASDEKEPASVLESFRPFAAARHQVGHPVSWNTDGEVPMYLKYNIWRLRKD